MTEPAGEGRPVPAPEAFERSGPDARLAQAALILAVGAGVAGATRSVERTEQFPLPPMRRLRRREPMSLEEAAGPLSVDTGAYVRGEVGVIPPEETARAARRVYDDPTPEHAAALVEACLHHPDRLIRTAAAASALDTTGPREEVVAVLEQSVHARDPSTRDIARVALARVIPQHAALATLVVEPVPERRRSGPSTTAVLTHGTFAARTRWWRPGGDFYLYLDALTPSLHLHRESFRWSGAYSSAARDLAADQLSDWVSAQQLQRPDLFGHSHGVTVANLATKRGLTLDRLVMLAWPVHDQWLPDLTNVRWVISHRVRMDLVILADRGGQRLPASFTASPKVAEHVAGWFRHSLPHEPDHWKRNQLDQHL
jgi:pimeloyl-ACP methyl ester carboxylesterase